MAPDAQVKQEDKKVNKDFNTLSFRYYRSGGPDNELFALIKAVLRLPEYEEDLPTSGMRKFIESASRIVTGKAKAKDVEFFERHLQTAKTQLPGVQN